MNSKNEFNELDKDIGIIVEEIRTNDKNSDHIFQQNSLEAIELKVNDSSLSEDEKTKLINKINKLSISLMKKRMEEFIKYSQNNLKTQKEELQELKNNYFGNIIAIMGIFLTIFMLVLGNIQIFQYIEGISLARTILLLFLAQSFLLICIIALVICIGYLSHNRTIIKNYANFIKSIFIILLLVPLFIWAYYYRHILLSIHGGLVILLAVAIIFFIMSLAIPHKK